MFLGLLLLICLLGLMGASLLLTLLATVALVIVAGCRQALPSTVNAKTATPPRSAVWAPGLLGAATALGVAYGSGWLSGL